MELVPNMIVTGGCTADIANILPWRCPYGSFKTSSLLKQDAYAARAAALAPSLVRSLPLARFAPIDHHKSLLKRLRCYEEHPIWSRPGCACLANDIVRQPNNDQNERSSINPRSR